MSGSELMKSFGERMLFLREHHHFTQEKLAELMECSTTFERKLEKGQGGTSFEMLIKLARAFNIEVIDLFQFDESVPQEKTTGGLDEEMLRQLFGRRLLFLRHIRERTQREVAKATRQTVSFIRMLEKGEKGPSFNTLSKLADFLDVDVKEFFRFGKSFPQDRHRATENSPEALPPSS